MNASRALAASSANHRSHPSSTAHQQCPCHSLWQPPLAHVQHLLQFQDEDQKGQLPLPHVQVEVQEAQQASWCQVQHSSRVEEP